MSSSFPGQKLQIFRSNSIPKSQNCKNKGQNIWLQNFNEFWYWLSELELKMHKAYKVILWRLFDFAKKSKMLGPLLSLSLSLLLLIRSKPQTASTREINERPYTTSCRSALTGARQHLHALAKGLLLVQYNTLKVAPHFFRPPRFLRAILDTGIPFTHALCSRAANASDELEL